MKAAVIVFPGSNCDRDCQVAIERSTGAKVEMVWHAETALPSGLDLIVLPGGFSYGDYLRCGAMAALSPVMAEVKTAAERGVATVGICNGFQVLCETGLLPGALLRNEKLKYVCKPVALEVTNAQTRFTAGYGAEYQHESVAISHALLAATEKLRVIAAVLPGPWHPAVLAKQIATMEFIGGGRFTLGTAVGHLQHEFDCLNEPWLEHDERYRRSQEFIEVLKGIWTQDNFTYKGDFYRFHDYTLKPKPLQQPHPEIFQGGSSRAARDMASRVSDWYFTNGNTVEGIKAQVDDIRAKAAANGHRVKVGVNAFIIARDTEEEAQAVLQEIIDKADPEAVNAFGDAVKQAGKASPEGEGNWAKSTFQDLVQYNDGFKTNLIGTPQQIAERIVALKAVGVDLVLSGFLHFQEEVAYFGEKVLPLVRALEAKAAAAKPAPELAEAA